MELSDGFGLVVDIPGNAGISLLDGFPSCGKAGSDASIDFD